MTNCLPSYYCYLFVIYLKLASVWYYVKLYQPKWMLLASHDRFLLNDSEVIETKC